MTSSGDICSFFFEPVYDSKSPKLPAVSSSQPSSPSSNPLVKKRGRKKRVSLGGANRHRCKVCHNVYTQAASTGYTNLLTHLRIKHPNWEEQYKAQLLVASSAEEGLSGSPSCSQSTMTTSSVPEDTDDVIKMKQHAGRKRGPVYEHFEDILSSSGTKQKKMRCLYCHEDTPQLSQRLKLHLSCKCRKVPEEIRTKYADSIGALSCKIEDVATVDAAAPSTPIAVTDTLLTTLKTPLPTAAAVKKMQTETIEQPLVVRTTSPAPTLKLPKRDGMINLQQFEEKLTVAVITADAPWSLLDNANFLAAMEALHPASGNFPLTSARARTEVLNRLSLKYDRVCNDVLATSNAVTLVVNNTDVCAEGVKKVTYVAFNERRRAFVLAEGNETSTVPFKTEILSVLSKLQSVSPNSALFLSTPTSGAYSHARRQLLRNVNAIDKPVVLMGACMIQQTALLVQEIVQRSLSLEEALDNAVLTADALHVMPSLRQHVLRGVNPDSSFIKEDTNAFVQVSVTSWHSIAMAVKQASRLEPFLRLAVSKEENNTSFVSILRQLVDMCSSDMAWNTLRHTAQLLVPLHFVSALSEMQSTTSGQLLALWIWLFGASMRSPLLDGNSDALIAGFMQRLNCYVEEHFVVCLVLDPRVHGAGLSVSGLRRARGVAVRIATMFISSFNENKFVQSYNEYMKQQGDFGEAGVWNAANTFSPMEFWDDYEGDPLHNQLAIVAKMLCSFVPNTCSMEELWSAHAQQSPQQESAKLSKEHEKCTKIRRGAALSTRVSAKDVASKFQTLFDVRNEISVEKMLQSNVTVSNMDGEETNRNLSVRMVLKSIRDGIDDDAEGSDAPSQALDTSWFDITSSGLDKLRYTMEKYLSVLLQQ